MKQKQIWSLAAVAVVAAAIAAAWTQAGRVPELVSPIAVTHAVALADGGSTHIELVDARGARFAFGTKGSLGVPRERFPVYVLRWASVPVTRDLDPGSPERRKLALLARRAASDNLKNLGQAMFLLEMAETLERGGADGS